MGFFLTLFQLPMQESLVGVIVGDLRAATTSAG
jgi:hypothetical protein